MEEKRKQMRKDISAISQEINDIVSTGTSSKKTLINEIPQTCQKKTADLSDVIREMQIPSFEPVCSFDMV